MPPDTIIPILVQRASASSIEWVVKMTQVFFCSLVMLLTTLHMNLLAPGSIPAEGSSSNMICGFPKIAMETCNFLLFPPESCSAGLSRYFSILNLRTAAVISLS